MNLEVTIPYPIRDCAEQYYEEAITDLARQVFLIPYRGEIGIPVIELKAAHDQLEQIMKDISDVFDIGLEQIADDIDAVMTSYPIEDFEQSLNLRKLNLLN